MYSLDYVVLHSDLSAVGYMNNKRQWLLQNVANQFHVTFHIPAPYNLRRNPMLSKSHKSDVYTDQHWLYLPCRHWRWRKKRNVITRIYTKVILQITFKQIILLQGKMSLLFYRHFHIRVITKGHSSVVLGPLKLYHYFFIFLYWVDSLAENKFIAMFEYKHLY
jgi:hypothetical protein